jgi:DNA-binding response OmpR family regulator
MRIRALVRRNYSIKSASITIGDIEILLDAKKVYQKEQEIHLSSLEIDLLVYLVRNRGKIISKEELLDKVW